MEQISNASYVGRAGFCFLLHKLNNNASIETDGFNVMIELVCTILNAKLGSCMLSKLDTAHSTCVNHCFAADYLWDLRDK